MTGRWPLVPLGEILTQDRNYIDRPEPRVYPKLSVKLYGKGVALDASTDGATLRMQRHQLAKAGQVILSEIWGKKGAIGLVPPEGDGALCTSHFFLFDIRRDRVEPGYLQAVLSSNYLAEQLGSEARGTTGYAAVRPQHLLAAEIRLPPLLEQRRMVARLEQVSFKVLELSELKSQVTGALRQLPVLLAHRPDLSRTEKEARCWVERPLADLMMESRSFHAVDQLETYPNLGIYSFGRGLFQKPPIDGARTSARELNQVRAGQFIYSRLFAFEGAYGVVAPEFDGYFVSNEYPTFDCNLDLALPEFLRAYFGSPGVWREVSAGSQGLGDRRQRVQPERLIAHRLLVPPLSEQRRLFAVAPVALAAADLAMAASSEAEALSKAAIHRFLGKGGYGTG